MPWRSQMVGTCGMDLGSTGRALQKPLKDPIAGNEAAVIIVEINCLLDIDYVVTVLLGLVVRMGDRTDERSIIMRVEER